MKIVDRLKKWVGIDKIEDEILLNRYGARNMDELYTMIMLGRTAAPTRLVAAKTWQLTVYNTLAQEYADIKKNGLRHRRKIKNKEALERYRVHLREQRAARRVADYSKPWTN